MLGHVHIALRNPATWWNITEHRCGLLMLAFTAWALLEMVIVMFLPNEKDTMLQPLAAR
jgi:hypothetical protein